MVFVLLHFWRVRGGFSNFYRKLREELPPYGSVLEIGSALALLRHLPRIRRGPCTVLIFTSLMAPVVLMLKLVCPRLSVHYHVRGDEFTWCLFQNRRLRALLGLAFQRLLRLLRCRFIFVSKDLQHRFAQRIGALHDARWLPNTVGQPLPPSRRLFRRIALVGDFGTVKNIEWPLASLSSGDFMVDVFGNTRTALGWERPWVTFHGHVANLSQALENSSIVVFSSVSEGFPWALVDALRAGCSVIVPRRFPFEYLPISPPWRFEMDSLKDALARASRGEAGPLERCLRELLRAPRDFRADNQALFELLEGDWGRLLGQALKSAKAATTNTRAIEAQQG